jgi:mxaJ protein
MSFPGPGRTCAALLLMLCAGLAQARELRVCADPNNLPFSHRDGSGFENRIIELIAHDLGATVRYTWWAQRRGMLRNTLNAGECDVVPGTASNLEGVATTRPYYRSSYVFVARRAGPWAAISSFDDPRLPRATIGVQLVGDDGANPPPAHALARRGMQANVRGYTGYGDYGSDAPQKAIIDAVARGDIDLAVAWGPTAGWFAKQSQVPLSLVPVTPWLDGPQWPMAFDISMAVRKDDRELRRELDRALERQGQQIVRILEEAGVPLAATQMQSAAQQSIDGP